MKDKDIRDFIENLQAGQFFTPLFSSLSGVYLFIKNRDLQFVHVNQGFAEMMGASTVEEMMGKSDFDYVPAFLAASFQKGDQEVLQEGKPVINKVELVPRNNGPLDWYSTSKIPLLNAKGEICGIAGITRRVNDSDEVYAVHPEMKGIVQYLREHYSEKITMPMVAESVGISVSKQERLFKKLFGITPLMYLQKIRLNAACSLIRNTKQDLASIATCCGFNDQTNMTRAFRTELKITPLKYRKNYSI